MKKALFGVVLVAGGAGLFALGWISHGVDKGSSIPSPLNSASASTSPASPVAKNPSSPSPLVSPADWQRLHATHDAVMQANPDLAAEYKQIIADMQAEEGKFDAAMAKVDPKATPIIAKLKALREHNQPPTTAVGQTPGQPPSNPPAALTADEWKELRSAHNSALQSNPSLLTDHEKQIQRMRTLEDNVDAAMVKIDPSLSPVIAKFEANRPHPKVASTPPSSVTPTAK